MEKRRQAMAPFRCRRLLKTRNDGPIVLLPIPSVTINDAGGNKWHALQLNVTFQKKFALFFAPLLFGMVFQASKSDLNINASPDKCVCTQRGVDYYKVLSLGSNCGDAEIKEA